MDSCTKKAFFTLFVITLFFGFISCGDMDETYRHFWEDGEKIYPSPVDSLKMYPGKNRTLLSWLIYGDPNVERVKIFWENNTDSLEVPIQATGGKDSVTVLIDDLEERAYSFDIYTYDHKGNRSILRSVTGNVYGETYANSVLSRSVINSFFVDDVLTIIWGSQADETSIGSELTYKDLRFGSYNSIFIDDKAQTTVIENFDSSDREIKFQTIYVPPMSIDTFYTAVQSIITKGPPQYLDRTGWLADASSFDDRAGASYRPPSNMLDNDHSTLWVNQISPQSYWPHTFTIDMGNVVDEVAGISLVLHRRNESPRSINVFVSVDGISWEPMGMYSVENLDKVVQDFDFYAPKDIRYYRVVAVEAWSTSNNITIAETYAYTY